MFEIRELSPDQFRRMQLVELDMLVEFDRVCRNNNINYVLIHGGFNDFNPDKELYEYTINAGHISSKLQENVICETLLEPGVMYCLADGFFIAGCCARSGTARFLRRIFGGGCYTLRRW